MSVDVCKILKEVVDNQNISDYALNCTKESYTLFIQAYIQNTCPTCPSPKCNKKEKICDNQIITVNCCNLCIYPNDVFPEVDPCSQSIFPNGTIPNVKMISPNDESLCQE